ncbi:MAG TPA: carboxypeptidase regulatory-like domain-containing protein [Mucilaginibacter sp.]|nr:carboxypeptidase regulatory-like domain-containing protein [Mucilaginibacter sp.]
MFKILFFFVVLPFGCLAQSIVSGRVLNNADKNPVANASVFLNNASVGNKTDSDGTFILSNVKPGKYELVVSIIGFEAYRQTIMVNNQAITLPAIEITPKTVALKEVSIKPKSDRDRLWKYERFKDEFLGQTAAGRECEILNPEVLDLDYDQEKDILTASSYDFLEIENPVLGYKIKYLLTDFTLDYKDKDAKKIHFEGSVLFENMKGTPGQQKRWESRRQVVYEGSLMHLLRSAIGNRMDEEGFRALRFATLPNPERPADSLINGRIKLYQKLQKDSSKYRDSLSYWVRKSKLPVTVQKLFEKPLSLGEIIHTTPQKGIYAFGYKGDALNVSYSKSHSFHVNNNPYYLDGPTNKETTLVTFNDPYALFDRNGSLINPNSVSLRGYWSRGRIAGLLPVDYEEPDAKQIAEDSTVAEKAITKLKVFSEQYVKEKAYLHFDKPYYAAGDTIYFKAYVTLGEAHRLSNLSGLLHVELINMKNKIDQSIKLQLTGGVGWGDFALPDSLPKGNYRIRAYTRWMRNAGSESYFDQVIPVGSGLKISESNTPRKTSANGRIDLQFFPEGGQLVTGIVSKVAFKAIGTNGLGTEVNGVIIDNAGTEVSKFSSAHLGMGYFYLKPEPGKTYKAKVTYADGSPNVIDLPQAVSKGMVLKVNNDSLHKATVQILSNESYIAENRGKPVDLLIYSGGIATAVSVSLDSSVVNLDLLKRRLKPGITKVTLFSAAGEPISERQLFIQNPDQLNLTLATDKAVYKKREKVHLAIKAINRADSVITGHFSVAVIDESKVVVDENAENTISNYLLLTSDLKGNIEQPNYYFTNINDKTRSDLDLVMLTHGYSRFEWKKVLNNDYPPVAWQPEKNLEIAGIATNYLGKPLVKGTVSLIPPEKGPLLSQVTDDKGNFRFTDLVFIDTAKFVLQAVKNDGKNTTKLVYNKDKELPAVDPPAAVQNENVNQIMPAYLENTDRQWEALNKSGKRKALKEVQIKDIRRDDHYRSSSLSGPGHADQVMHAEEIEMASGQLSTSLNGRLRGIVFLGGIPYLSSGATIQPMLVVLDGAVMYPSPGKAGYDVDNISLSDVETVEVLKYTASAAIYGMDSGHGVLVLTTKLVTGRQNKDISSTGILPISVQGYYKAREFYSPKYTSILDNGRKDLRSTIYWRPEIVTDKDGNASIDYFNADGAGSYRVIIQGMDDKGDIGWQIYRYKVE